MIRVIRPDICALLSGRHQNAGIASLGGDGGLFGSTARSGESLEDSRDSAYSSARSCDLLQRKYTEQDQQRKKTHGAK